ncbi:sensor histidine kinase [Hanstruepera marina]|uniref:sensor histidine kinase n=1 Tax=Hanstruepera marina TaxID=2873265 RepID=UPI001CA7A9F1|nr:HAMP domain-containing sensor histidine kinase [Hanstruepera marina]
MNDIRYKWILNTIVVVILCTIAIQVYWNYKNYLTNKQQLINDVQISLDNAVDGYYTSIAQHNTMAFAFELNNESDLKNKQKQIDSIIQNIDLISQNILNDDSLRIDILEDISVIKENDSIKNKVVKKWMPSQLEIRATNHSHLDSLTEDSFKLLTSKVIYSMTNDSLKIDRLDSLIQLELDRKSLNVDYALLFKSPFDTLQSKNYSSIKNSHLKTMSKSAYLPKGSLLEIRFTNSTAIILKRILSGLFLSLLLVLGVIGCLFYLLKVIKHQKQLAEVKNDLISNITHEFKTPIATIGVALESIKNFNIINDKEKTKSYLNMSEEQLKKLNTMVEKLLETASLDSDNLELKKESVNVSELIEKLVYKHQLQIQSKTLELTDFNSDIFGTVDVFHFENAINNIIDNAIKYGGDTIKVSLSKNSIGFTVSVSDNENSLTEEQKHRIFEKFYRIPKGNTHDVKGFGIGLYYTKKIIENHGGVISLKLGNNQKIFKITLPNG